MKRKVIIAVAPVKNPGVPLPEQCMNPVTPEQIHSVATNLDEHQKRIPGANVHKNDIGKVSISLDSESALL